MKEQKPPTSKEIFQLLNGLIRALGRETVLKELMRRLDSAKDLEMMAASLPIVLWTVGRKRHAEHAMALLEKYGDGSQRTKKEKRKSGSQ
jgi:hypothetical protein